MVFLLFAPLVELRALVYEITYDLVPVSIKRSRWVKTFLEWQAPPVSQPESPSPAA